MHDLDHKPKQEKDADVKEGYTLYIYYSLTDDHKS